MAAKDARDRGILNGDFEWRASAFDIHKEGSTGFRIHIHKEGSTSFVPYAYGAQTYHSKSPHAAEGIAGRVSALDIKAEWFFHETRSGARQQWAEDRKATRPKLRDPDFLAENAARGGMAVSKERQLLADFENELDQVFVQLPKYAVVALTAGADNFFSSLIHNSVQS